MQRRIPYAVANYEEIVRDRYHFVDKTAFIRDLEQYKAPVFLRPRRFGKSLWCSILECYYDVRRAERFEELFGKTAIGREPTAARNYAEDARFPTMETVASATDRLRATGKHIAGERAGERARVLHLTEPLQEDAAQVERYAVALQHAHPELTIRRYVAYTAGARDGRLVEVS